MRGQENVERWEVSEEDKRGRQRGDVCFYCAEPTRHKPSCVIPQKIVKVRMTLEFERAVPYSWDGHMIEFHMNDSSWCAGNIIDELTELDDVKGCLCNVAEFELLTPSDGGEKHG